VILRTVDIARVGRVTAAVTAVAAAASALVGVGDWLSVLLGGAVMIANYHLIRMLVSRLIGADQSTGKAAFALVAKLVLMIALVAGVLYRFPIAPGSFAVGATSLLVAMLLEACLFGTPVAPLADDGEDFEGSDS
jgi:hypothetical protein